MPSNKQSETAELSQVAYFGPAGNYTELALNSSFHCKQQTPCLSIAEVFNALAEGKADFGFVPIENVAQGPVAETLDCLFRHRGDITILSSSLLGIRHCLGVPQGSAVTKDSLATIRQVYSHEQALRQCSHFLRTNMPQAELCAAPSTAAAAQAVAAGDSQHAAVIAAGETLQKLGFELLAEDIADLKNNRTRFVLLGRSQDAVTVDPFYPKGVSPSSCTQITSIALDPGRDRKGILHEVLSIISVSHRVNLLSIHSRPDAKGGFVFHFDLEGGFREPAIQHCLADLRSYCAEATGSTAEVTLFGSYPQERFHSLPFSTVGIIGGKGVMGRWFETFLRRAGLVVEICDTDTECTAADLAARADVLLLSVPMSAMDSVIGQIAPALQPGTLVVENSSIKASALPKLLTSCPEGVETLGIHTMFAGDIAELRDQNVIITKTATSGEKAQAFEDLLYKYGAKLTHADSTAHDQMSAYLQSLFQLTLVGLAEVLRETTESPEDIEPFSTPNSRNLLTSMERVVRQSDELLADLQTFNQQYPRIRHLYLQTLFELIFSLDRDDAGRFLESAAKSRTFFDQQK